MRTSAARIKRGDTRPLPEAPTPGTRLRKLYDMFLAHPLTPIHLDVILPFAGGGKAWSGARKNLESYELDIRRHSPKRWWLVATEQRDYLGEAVARQA